MNKPDVSGYIVEVLNKYLSGNAVTLGSTGALTGTFYPLKTNPSGYLTGIPNIYVLKSDTGNFLTAIDLASYVSQVIVQTDQRYGRVRVSGSNFITGAHLSGVGGLAVLWQGDKILISGAGSSTTVANVVYTTGNQIISGEKTFLDRLTVNELFNPSSENYITLSAGTLYDGTNSQSNSLDWGNRDLIDGSNSPSLNWGNKQLIGQWISTIFDIYDSSLAQPVFSCQDQNDFYLRGANNPCLIDLNGSFGLGNIVSGFDISGKNITSNGQPVVTGSIVRPSETGDFIRRNDLPVFRTGDQTISGNKTFATTVRIPDIYHPQNDHSVVITNGTLYDGNSQSDSLNWQSRQVFDRASNITVDWDKKILSGNWTGTSLAVSGSPVVTKNHTGALYPATGNPSGFLLTGITIAGNGAPVFSGIVGATMRFYSVAGTNGITANSAVGGDPTVYLDGSALVRRTESGRFYPATGNPTGFAVFQVTGSNVVSNPNISGVSGFRAILSGNSIILLDGGGLVPKTLSGTFYPATGNPSGFVLQIKNANQMISGGQLFVSSGLTVGPRVPNTDVSNRTFVISDDTSLGITHTPTIMLHDNYGLANYKNYYMIAGRNGTSGRLDFGVLNDTNNAGVNWLTVTRSITDWQTFSQAELTSNSIVLTAPNGVSVSNALSVGGAATISNTITQNAGRFYSEADNGVFSRFAFHGWGYQEVGEAAAGHIGFDSSRFRYSFPVHIDSTFSILSNPNGANGDINYFDAYYTASNYTHTIRVYGYVNTPQGRILTTDYSEHTLVDDGSENSYSISWFWNRMNDVDGYMIFKQDDYNAFNFDVYMETAPYDNFLYDDGSSWVGGSPGDYATSVIHNNNPDYLLNVQGNGYFNNLEVNATLNANDITAVNSITQQGYRVAVQEYDPGQTNFGLYNTDYGDWGLYHNGFLGGGFYLKGLDVGSVVDMNGTVSEVAAVSGFNTVSALKILQSGNQVSTVKVSGSQPISIANFTGVGGTTVTYRNGLIEVSGAAGGGGGGSNVTVTGSTTISTANFIGASGLRAVRSGDNVLIGPTGKLQWYGDEAVFKTVNLTGAGNLILSPHTDGSSGTFPILNITDDGWADTITFGSTDGVGNLRLLGRGIVFAEKNSKVGVVDYGGFDLGGNMSLGFSFYQKNPSARLHIESGGLALPPLAFTSGKTTTTPVTGAMEYDGSRFYLTTAKERSRVIRAVDLPVFQTGDQNVSGVKTFKNTLYAQGVEDYVAIITPRVGADADTFIDFTNATLYAYAGSPMMNWQSGLGFNVADSSVTFDWPNRVLSGNWTGSSLAISGSPVITRAQTGEFMPTGKGRLSTLASSYSVTPPNMYVSGATWYRVAESQQGLSGRFAAWVNIGGTGKTVNPISRVFYINKESGALASIQLINQGKTDGLSGIRVIYDTGVAKAMIDVISAVPTTGDDYRVVILNDDSVGVRSSLTGIPWSGVAALRANEIQLSSLNLNNQVFAGFSSTRLGNDFYRIDGLTGMMVSGYKVITSYETGTFYPATGNPSGFAQLTVSGSTVMATPNFIGIAGTQVLRSGNNVLVSGVGFSGLSQSLADGLYYPLSSNPAQYMHITGDELVNGNKNFNGSLTTFYSGFADYGFNACNRVVVDSSDTEIHHYGKTHFNPSFDVTFHFTDVLDDNVSDDFGAITWVPVEVDGVAPVNGNILAIPVHDVDTCFLGDTQILTPKGLKRIDEIKMGDEVISVNVTNGEVKPDVITKIKSHIHKTGYLIINEKVKVTSNHRLFVNDKWIRAGKVKIGDYFRTPDNKKAWLYSLELVADGKPVPVYSIHMDNENHNYFADGILAHNNKCPFIYALDKDGNLVYQNTFLYNIDSEEKETTQVRPLKTLTNKFIIKEIEPETSYIKGLALLAENAGGNITRLKLLNRPEKILLNQGDHLVVEFEALPEGTTKLYVEAFGYYKEKIT